MNNRGKKSNGTTRLTSVYILDIIKEAGPEGIRKSDINKKLEEKYEQSVDIKTIGFFLDELLYADKISTIVGTKKYILTNQILTDDDLDILEDLIIFSKGIHKEYVLEILEKTEKLRSAHSNTNKKYLAEMLLRTDNENILENLKIIRKAITQKKQIEIVYKRGSIQTISPYELAIFNSIYYVICHYPKRNYENLHEKLETRRVDRIKSVKILDETVVNYREVVDNSQTADFSTVDYVASRIYPMSGDEISIHLRIPKSSEHIIKEYFLDSNVRVLSNDLIEMKVVIRTNKKAFISWYVAYAELVGEIERPVELREEIRAYAQQIVDKYRITKLNN